MSSLKNRNSILLLPDLVEIQRSSFRWFLEDGLKEVLSFLPNLSDPTESLGICPSYDIEDSLSKR